MKDEILNELRAGGDQALEALDRSLSRVRTGRANLSILDNIRVEYYGSKTPLNQVATLTVADPRLITIKPFDKNMLSDIERTLAAASDLGISPQSDGTKIMLPFPPLTEERRKEMVKVAKGRAEEAKISIRNARRDANEQLKMLEKDGEIPEDDAKKAQGEVQKVTDDYVKKVDVVLAKKEKEIMEV